MSSLHAQSCTRQDDRPPRGHQRLVFLACLFILSPIYVSVQDATSSTAQFSEPATGLPMERFFGARTQFGFAMTLPDSATPSPSFIGQMTFPLAKGGGWGSMGLSGDMEGIFALAVWPDGAGGVMASFRQATDEDNPPEVSGASAVRPIAEGASVNDTFLTYTFLCESCLDAQLGLGPEATGADAVMGWALSEGAVRDPANPAANLGFHERGFGPFMARLGSVMAPQAQFDAVAGTAGQPVDASGGVVAATPSVFKDGGGDDGDDDSTAGSGHNDQDDRNGDDDD